MIRRVMKGEQNNMASYGYEAINRAGKEVKGSLEAESIEDARAELKRSGMTIMNVEEQNLLTKDVDIDLGGAPKIRDLAVFSRQFVSMIKAGVTILDALKMLGEQTENKKLKKALIEVRVNVEKGETLAHAMEQFPKVFPPIMISMVLAGEASGSLDVAFDRVAIQLERSGKTQGLIKKAMIYPTVVLIVAVCVIILMLVKVVPAYMDMFEDLGTDLPGITVAVVGASNFFIHHWLAILIVVVALVFGFKAFGKTNFGKHVFGKIVLHLPLIKGLAVKSASSQMARTLSTLTASGVPMVEAVDIVSNVMGNIWFREAMQYVKNEVLLGEPISRPLEKCGLFPPMVYHMVRIGEESGDVEDMLDKVADYYDEEVELSVQSLMAAMEPLIIILLAAIVGVIIAAVMAPMMRMYSALENI